jgi:hypothetical protein
MKTHFVRPLSIRTALRRIAGSGLADIAVLSLFAACFILAFCAVQGR